MNPNYEKQAFRELKKWQKEMLQNPGTAEKFSKNIQRKINRLIPEKAHQGITLAFREMVKGLLSGTQLISETPLQTESLEERERIIRGKVRSYTHTAAAEGIITGAGGFLMSLADFPIWLSLKIRMLSTIAATYGHDLRDIKERVFLLFIFQLCFSGRERRKEVFLKIREFETIKNHLPEKLNELDWRNFQQEYRDFLDIAKTLQMIPGIGAAVGGVVNHSLTGKLARTAMNAYRMRWFQQRNISV